MSNYDDNSIKVLSDIAHIRLRPSMYISTDRPSYQMWTEIADNAVDEAMNGYADTIKFNIDYENGSISVEDNGRGLPQGMNKDLNKPTIFAIYQKLNAGGKYDQESYAYSGGLNGVGSTVVNALSKELYVRSWRNRSVVSSMFRYGEINNLAEDYQQYDDPSYMHRTGTYVSYTIDNSLALFADKLSDYEQDIINKVNLLKTLMPKVHIWYNGEEIKSRDFREFLQLSKEPLFEESILIESKNYYVALNWSKDTNKTSQIAYCNSIFNPHGGDHINAIYNAVSDIFGTDGWYGINVAVSINYPGVEYDSQAKTKAVSKEMKNYLTESFTSDFKSYLRKNPQTKVEISNLISYKRRELNKRNNKNNVRRDRKSTFLNTLGSVSFADCNTKNREEAELYIVEGNSAAGSAKQARDVETQAVMPLRGKILNVVNADVASILNNREIATIYSNLDTGVFQDFNIRKARYGKVIIFCFTGDTKVRMLDGTNKTFYELVELEKENPDQDYWVYSMTPEGKMVPGLAKHPRITQYTDRLCHVILDNEHEIKCTLDHLFMLRDGTYKEAQYLTSEDSLMPLYTRRNKNIHYNNDREMIYNNQSGEWEFTHHRVFEEYNNYLPSAGHCIHHRDIDYLNNEPVNLVDVDSELHKSYHGRVQLSSYNQSDSHKERVKELHGQGIYEHTYFGNNGYNESEVHKHSVSQAWKDGKYEVNREKLINYNKSEKNSESTINLNRDEEAKRLQQRGKIAKSGKAILDKGYELNEDLILSGDYETDYRRLNINTIMKYYGTFHEFVEASKNYNHKVSKVWIEELESPIPMYDFTVKDYHNFVTPVDTEGNGIVVHQCDADEDGKNIASLLIALFMSLSPELVEEGRLYLALPPLYGVQIKDEFIPISDEEVKNKYVKEGFHVTRYKGLGEMNPEQLRVSCMAPETRKLIRIDKSEECEELVKRIMGADTSFRKELLIREGVLV